MKTAMEKKETGLMRQIGYLSFVVVLLYGLDVYKRQEYAPKRIADNNRVFMRGYRNRPFPSRTGRFRLLFPKVTFRDDRRVRLHLAARVPRAVVLFCPLAHRPERLLSEKEAGNVPSGDVYKRQDPE